MSETPESPRRRRLSRASIFGAALGLAGVVLFILVWGALGNAGIDFFPRLVISICAPPALIALVAGVYILVFQPGSRT